MWPFNRLILTSIITSILASFAFLAFPFASVAQIEPACVISTDETATLSQISERNELSLKDGRLVRLAGITLGSLPQGESSWPDFLTKLTQDSTIRLALSGEKDRWGRYSAQVFVKPHEANAEAWLQGFLLEIGAARLLPENEARKCWQEMRKLEEQARKAKLGLWALKDAVLKSSEPAAILRKRGQLAMVEGKIIGIGETRGVFYLNFGRSWQNDFTVIVLKRQLKLFEAASIHPRGLESKYIRVRGIVDGQNGPRIEAALPEQIEKLD